MKARELLTVALVAEPTNSTFRHYTEVVLAALATAAGAAEGDTVTIGPDGTVGRLNPRNAQFAAHHQQQDDERAADSRCTHDLGRRPSWMSPDQYDPCRCLLPKGHDGEHECSHTRAGAES